MPIKRGMRVNGTHALITFFLVTAVLIPATQVTINITKAVISGTPLLDEL